MDAAAPLRQTAPEPKQQIRAANSKADDAGAGAETAVSARNGDAERGASNSFADLLTPPGAANPEQAPAQSAARDAVPAPKGFLVTPEGAKTPQAPSSPPAAAPDAPRAQIAADRASDRIAVLETGPPTSAADDHTPVKRNAAAAPSAAPPIAGGDKGAPPIRVEQGPFAPDKSGERRPAPSTEARSDGTANAALRIAAASPEQRIAPVGDPNPAAMDEGAAPAARAQTSATPVIPAPDERLLAPRAPEARDPGTPERAAAAQPEINARATAIAEVAVASPPKLPAFGANVLGATVSAAAAEAPATFALLSEARAIAETASVEGANRLPAAQAARDPSAAPALQVAAAIRATGHIRGESRIEVALSPPELGRVVVALDIAEDAVKAVLTAERDDAAALLRRHGELLIRDLRAAGFEDVRLSHGASGGAGGDGAERGGEQGQEPAPTATAALEAPPPRSARAAQNSALDLRL